MRLAVGEFAAYPYYEYAAEFAANGVFALLGIHAGIHLKQFLGMDEMDGRGEKSSKLRIASADKLLCIKHASVYLPHYLL